MATTYSSANSRNAFADIVSRNTSTLNRSLSLGKADAAKAQAIAVLGDDNAAPDLKDWAERYLCGLAGADPAKYFENHKWQG
jgi:hypothetical protein